MPSAETWAEELLGTGLGEAFVGGYELSQFWVRSIIASDFEPPGRVADLIVPTASGQEALEELHRRHGGIPEPVSLLALFCHLGYASLLVDLDESDAAALRAVCSDMILGRQVRHPYVFGRVLHDAARSLFDNVPRVLSEPQTQQLLDAVEPGVFQVGHVLSGPFGLLQSLEVRRVDPVTRPLLAHCTDPSCRREHPVRLSTAQSQTAHVFQQLEEVLVAREGAPANWEQVWSKILKRDEAFFADFNPGGLPWIIGNGLSVREKRALLAEVIRSNQQELRELIPEASPSGVTLSGSPEQIVDSLGEAELLQLILLEADVELSSALDRCVSNGSVRVPFTEVRTAVFSPSNAGGFLRQQAEVGDLGVRFISRGDIATGRLAQLVMRLHDVDDLSSPSPGLEWALMGMEGPTLAHKLDALLSKSEPRELIERFCLGSLDAFEETIEYLRFGHFEAPTTSSDRELATDRIAWKLGFDLQRQDPADSRFREELAAAVIHLDAADFTSPTGRSAVRSASVNLFVETEAWLERAICFVNWALWSDHYGGPPTDRFVYEPTAARRLTAARLNGRPLGEDDRLAFPDEGPLNLFALVEAFRLTAQAVSEVSDPTVGDRRPSREIPPYSRHSKLRRMPFSHRAAIFDIGDESRTAISDLLRRTHHTLVSANLLGVRNRIPHSGREFPSAEEFAAVLEALDVCHSQLLSAGAIPLVWRLTKGTIDEFHRVRRILEVEGGQTHELSFDQSLTGCGLPSAALPQIVFVAATVRGTAQPLRFSIRAKSDFTEMWRDYASLDELDEETDESYELANSAPV